MKIKTDRKGLASIGDMIRHKTNFYKVVGYAVDTEGKDCYVCETCRSFGNELLTMLIPCNEVNSVLIEKPLVGGEHE